MFKRLVFLLLLQFLMSCSNTENSNEIEKLNKQLLQKEELITDLNKEIERLRQPKDSISRGYYRFVETSDSEINVAEKLFGGEHKIINRKYFNDTIQKVDSLFVYEYFSTITQTSKSDFEAVLKDFHQEKSIYGEDFFVRVMTFYNGEKLPIETENSKTDVHILIQATELGYENKTFVISDFYDVNITSLIKLESNKVVLIFEHGAIPKKKETIIISPELVKFKEDVVAVDLDLLYGVWASDVSDPHAEFMINTDEFYLADTDGDASYKYTLENNLLKVFYKNATQSGEIISVTKDSLKIKWGDTDTITKYVRFPENQD